MSHRRPGTHGVWRRRCVHWAGSDSNRGVSSPAASAIPQSAGGLARSVKFGLKRHQTPGWLAQRMEMKMVDDRVPAKITRQVDRLFEADRKKYYGCVLESQFLTALTSPVRMSRP